MKKLLLFLALSTLVVAKTQTIVFAAGCFWGVEKYYDNLDGVIEARSGYAGGNYENPTYKRVLQERSPEKGIKNYAESVEVVYDDTKISTEKLIKSFWELHDPTQGNRQGNDVGNNYRSAIYYTTDKQKAIALQTKAMYQKLLTKAHYGTITTQIQPLEKFYPAENYHQNYLTKNPFGYCSNHATGVKFTKQMHTTVPLIVMGGKEIIVVKAKHCGFCEKFKKDVLNNYKGTIPLREAYKNQLAAFKIHSKIEGTPTILFFQDGKEVYAHTGYMDEKSFYKALAAFKLGKGSEG